jgi:predicted PurR-regulated permease PerM
MKEPEAKARAAPVDHDWSSPEHVRSLMLMMATVIGLYLCYRLTVPFLSALAWALALGVVFLPFQRWLERKVKQRTVAALISVTLIGGTILGLVVFVGQRLKIHTLSVFVSVVGGVIAFGASGIVLGPVILAITTELLEVWHRRAAAGS